MTVSGSWSRAAEGAMLLGPDGTLAQTIFAEMTALATATNAVNLGQGFPDEDGPPEVLEAARKAISDGANQYPPGVGIPVLRQAIARHQKRFYDLDIDPDREVVVTAGATEALAATILALTEPGDEVVTFEPFYDSYAAIIGLARAVHRVVPLRAPHFQPDHEQLRAAITDRTRLIIVNDPHNPTGSVFSTETLDLVVELAHRHDAIIVTDEVYEHLVFASAHTPLATRAGAAERTVSISSAGKTFNTTGWKVGWLTAPAPLASAILAVKQYLTYSNAAPLQPAIAVGLDLPDTFFSGAAATLARRRDLLCAGLEAAGFGVAVPSAGYFVVADAAPLGATDAHEFCRALPERAGVAAIPLTAFVRPERQSDYSTLVRFAFCKRDDVLQEASERLRSLR
ncbi:pyridoxal phosphate-dependent aminotransferase [Homoserinimonas hongtaonis]|uniref:Putative succinyldiaminopimelate transaminase DapC n=1 Tax=Homoserinimonas hongtaonis TaxID=2079791 RepID=A0A2U1SX12_9MICO|nr:pyridoxal phosphate-dependent aminotransferase [Salinibacterium hongtaonis]AWB88718.1 putative succinyldiaminopimelate transaminase DapC [Salinibacterium hongtaonis]PWB96128.1 putative succinyldiaminopimelate transaminase DapC [Salinibacterium hongtaonis]